ncbi:hypothetical protein [Polynucleobacter sp.]|uniref:hypothetical protein n=1 Tax=Polynucleobacter sp. TaxID=2029855 RepID=UPI003341C72A
MANHRIQQLHLKVSSAPYLETLLASGTSLISVSKMAGHANPSTTINIYGHETKSHQELLRGAIDGSFAKTELDRFSTDKESRTA